MTSMSSAEAVTAVRADDVDVDEVVVAKGSEPIELLVGSNNILTTFLRR